MSFVQLPVARVCGQESRADRGARLEQIGANGDRFHSCPLGRFRRRESLKVNEVEDLPLARGQLGEKLPDDARGALAVDATARVRRIYVAQGRRRG